MAIYIDVSSAVHAKAGIGRYAGSLAQALIAREPGRFAGGCPGADGASGIQAVADGGVAGTTGGYRL
jgi:hypothetical protein